ncbi:MAG: TonB family protein [Gammaproteobacteria bacterium]|nr:TonB family protein [Gammaproteobacteria bacterium]
MSREEKRRCAAFIAASLLLHAAALAWLDLSGADVGRLPSKLTVLLESRSKGDGPEVKEEPTSVSRSRDLFDRPPSRLAKTGPSAKAERGSAVVEAASPPQRVAPTETSEPQPRVEAKTRKRAPEPRPAPAPPENYAIEAASRVASAATVAAAKPEPAAAAAVSGTAERQGELLSLLHQAISREKRYPLLARRQRREGTTTVVFSLSPSGELDAIGVDRSSGFSLLDTAAVSAVSRVAPFGPARLFLSDVTRFKVNVTFKLN